MPSSYSTGNNLTSGQIKWTGMASGIDFSSVVEALVASEERVITRQQTWQSQWEEKLTAINNLDVRLGSLKDGVRSFDTRDELLARKAVSSKESVATISNTSTAATGVYNIEVGENIVEKLASRTYDEALAIGANLARNSAGHLLDINGEVIGTDDHTEDSILKALAAKTGKTGITFSGTDYLDDTSTIIASWNVALGEITLNGQGSAYIKLENNHNGTGRDEFVIASSGATIATSLNAHVDAYYEDFVIEMGGKEMRFQYDASGALESSPGVLDSGLLAANTTLYSSLMTMDDLAELINRAATTLPNMPDVQAEVVFDKTRGSATHGRLIVTAGEGGVKNHIKISDPTNLYFDRNYIDEPVTTSLLGSSFVPSVDASSDYTGHVNKTITVMVNDYKGNGILGQDDVLFSWADTSGYQGSFVVKSSDWDPSTNSLIKPIEILQGLKINLAGAGSDPSQNRVIKSEAFTIDCQNPLLQQAADLGLAQTDKWVHQGLPDLTSPVTFGSSGKLVLSYAGAEYSVVISDGLGLNGMVDRINSDPKNPGIVASVLNDGMGTATSYKLVLTGHREGAENSIRILDSSSLNRMGTGADSWTHAREASNSMCRIDGYPNDGSSWIQRSTNEVGDVLNGVVVKLEGVGESQIIVQNNISEMVDRVKMMVEGVNFCKSYIQEQTKFSGAKLVSKVLKDGTVIRATESGKDANGDSSTDPSGVMIGNYGFQIAQSTIDRLMTKQIFTREEFINAIDPRKKKEAKYPVTVEDEERDGPSQEGAYQAYLEENGLAYMRLSDIGIASDPSQHGQYIIEESKLTEALSKNPEAVMKLFTFRPNENLISTELVYTDEDERSRIGGFAVMMGYAMNDMTRSQDDFDRHGNLVASAKGITRVLADNYSKIISGIDEKIAREERRIQMVRTRHEEKFNRLEVLLANLENQSTKIQAQLGQLGGGKSE